MGSSGTGQVEERANEERDPVEALADEFMHDLRSLMPASDAKDDVYQVAISIFPVTTLKKTRGDNNA